MKCWESLTNTYFWTTKAMIEKAVNGVNKQLLSDFRVSENDLLDYLGIDHCVNGDLLGWDTDSGLNVDIFYASRLDEDGNALPDAGYSHASEVAGRLLILDPARKIQFPLWR